MARNTPVSLRDHFANFVDRQVAGARSGSAIVAASEQVAEEQAFVDVVAYRLEARGAAGSADRACGAGRLTGNMLSAHREHGPVAEPATRKMASYRGRLRARGLRPAQFWVPDLRDPAVRDRLRADAALVRGHASTVEGDSFVDAALADLADWRG